MRHSVRPFANHVLLFYVQCFGNTKQHNSFSMIDCKNHSIMLRVFFLVFVSYRVDSLVTIVVFAILSFSHVHYQYTHLAINLSVYLSIGISNYPSSHLLARSLFRSFANLSCSSIILSLNLVIVCLSINRLIL